MGETLWARNWEGFCAEFVERDGGGNVGEGGERGERGGKASGDAKKDGEVEVGG